MPSSPTFHDYTRKGQRWFYRGISLLPQDALGEGKVALAQNIRSRVEGEITVRDALVQVTTGALDGPANTLMRLNDPALLAGGASARRFYGTEEGTLYAATPNGTTPVAYAEIDDGYSGDPLSGVPAMPVGSPQPWLYIGDSDKIRKVDAALNIRSIGLPPPATPAEATLAANQTTFLQSIDSGSWSAFGARAGGVAVGAGARLSAVVNAAIYDDGATGMCSVALDDMTGITEGSTVDRAGDRERGWRWRVQVAVAPADHVRRADLGLPERHRPVRLDRAEPRGPDVVEDGLDGRRRDGGDDLLHDHGLR